MGMGYVARYFSATERQLPQTSMDKCTGFIHLITPKRSNGPKVVGLCGDICRDCVESCTRDYRYLVRVPMPSSLSECFDLSAQ